MGSRYNEMQIACPIPDRVIRSPQIMGGKPCLRGMRVTVGMIVGLVAAGHSHAEILSSYPYLEDEHYMRFDLAR